MEASSDTIFEERVELMVSPVGKGKGIPNLRTAYFLKPTTKTPPVRFPSISLNTELKTCIKVPLKVQFKAWRNPMADWKMWVQNMEPKYQSLWKQVGIYEAIICSTHRIIRHEELVLGLAEKWCPETNTFIFPWGEATITLQDILVNGGFPVLGQLVSSSPLMTEDERKIYENLSVVRANARTACVSTASYATWLQYFMGSGSEFEYEAFLSAWLSKFVFLEKYSHNFISAHVFTLAIRLAKGMQIALAPAVLSSIYRDLTLLKEKLVTMSTEKEILILYAPFHLVQIWAWERFPVLQPNPNDVVHGEPRAARWQKLRMQGSFKYVIMALDSAGESFVWRPYASAVHRDNEQCSVIEFSLEKDFMSFARCLRVSEIVGLSSIEQYLPHRVAGQFGMDQDLPSFVARCNGSLELAWSSYDSPIRYGILCIPPLTLEGGVTVQYLNWWTKAVLGVTDETNACLEEPMNCNSVAPIFPGSPSECHQPEIGDFVAGNNQEPLGSIDKFSNSKKILDVIDELFSVFQGQRSPTRIANSVDFGEPNQLLEVQQTDVDTEPMITKAVDTEPMRGCQCQVVSSSSADKEGITKMESEIKSEPILVQGEGSLVVKGKEMKEAIAGKEEVRCGKGGSTSYCIPDKSVSELEARIGQLETVVAGLKTRRFGANFSQKA